ncbi:unnamed protein product [Cyprideis torosa]|uniref:Uncharacterized protein n=1 Tax=Cyprideis torosa TaxID=163714 RepID=A0A7R8ZPX8_9CRUS|nr:unnamed protein product [Cyprideis torosa]CAG0889332.1 unnamed protein product [Cyprideis torosa]
MQLTSVFTVTTVLLQWTKAAPQRSDKVSIIYFPEDEPRPLRPWERQNSDGILKRTLTPTRVKPAKPSSHKTSTRRQLTRDILIHFPPDGYTTPADGYTTPADDHTTPKSAVQRRTQLTTTDVDDIVIRYPTNGQNIPGGKLLDRPSIDTFDLPSATDVDNSLLTKKSSSKHTDTDDSDGADSSSEEASKKDCPLRVQLPHDQEAEAICIPEWQCKGLVLVGYELGSECGSSERRYVCCNRSLGGVTVTNLHEVTFTLTLDNPQSIFQFLCPL